MYDDDVSNLKPHWYELCIVYIYIYLFNFNKNMNKIS